MNNSPQRPPLNSGHVVGRQQWHERCKGPAMTVRHNMLIRNRITSCPVNTTSRTQDFHHYLPLALKVTKEPRDRVFWPRWTVGNYDKKSPWFFAHVEHRVQVNRARYVDHATRVCKRFVHSIVSEKFTRCAKVCGLFSLDCPFQVLIGWAGKRRSHGSRFCTAPANDYRVHWYLVCY